MRIDFFNGQSFIELVDFASLGNKGEYCGDWAVVDGARVSFGRKASEFSFAKNKDLAEYLWDAGDRSPFDQFVMQFRARVPIHIALWWFLFPHASYDEISGRYTKTIAAMDHCFVPPEFPGDLKECLKKDFEESSQRYRSFYDAEKFEAGEKQVAKELARSALLYSFSTEFIFTVSLRKLAHFLLFFANHPLFSEIHKAFFLVIGACAPIFCKQFQKYWENLKTAEPEWPFPQEYHFFGTERGVLGDEWSAVRLERVVGSDSDLAATLRISQGLRGDDYSVIKRALSRAKGDNISPEFSRIGLHLVLQCPVYIFRQMYRHKRASWYGLTLYLDRFYVPQVWRAQRPNSRYLFDSYGPKKNKELTARFREYVEERKTKYYELLAQGIPQSFAERFIPYAFYVSVFRSGDGIELFNFLNLRCDWHAQYEHQQYAMKIAEIFANNFPLTFLAWKEEYWEGQHKGIEEIYRRLK